MIPDDFDRLARTVWGEHYKASACRTFDVLGSTVRAWQRGIYDIPDAVADELRSLAAAVADIKEEAAAVAWSVEPDADHDLDVLYAGEHAVAYKPPGVSEDDHLGGWRFAQRVP